MHAYTLARLLDVVLDSLCACIYSRQIVRCGVGLSLCMHYTLARLLDVVLDSLCACIYSRQIVRCGSNPTRWCRRGPGLSLCIPRIQPEGVDVVLDCLCGEDTNKGISILKPLGRYVLFGEYHV